MRLSTPRRNGTSCTRTWKAKKIHEQARMTTKRSCQENSTQEKMQAKKAVIGMILKTEKKDNCQSVAMSQRRILHSGRDWLVF